MKFAGYKRAATDAEAREARTQFRAKAKELCVELSMFKFDLTMGQRGLLQTLRAARSGDVQGVIVDELKDLGRDLTSLVKALDELVSSGRIVYVLSYGLRLDGRTQEGKMTEALMRAHHAYVSQNRKRGIESAIAAGAQAGRPAGLILDDVQEIIEKLMNANKGQLPSVRDLAKEANCSIGHSQKLLKQYKTKLNDDATAQTSGARAQS
jgi:DNA invertase Pin-like site-specific DNA recombinase